MNVKESLRGQGVMVCSVFGHCCAITRIISFSIVAMKCELTLLTDANSSSEIFHFVAETKFALHSNFAEK